MTAYKLFKLAAGGYNVALKGIMVASLVRSDTPSRVRTWTTEFLIDLPPEECRAPVIDSEHHFGSFEEAREPLGPSRG